MMQEDEELSEVFCFYCHERHAAENFLVWKAIQNFKKDPTIESANDIMETYLKEDSPQQINIDYFTIELLEQILSSEELLDGSKPLCGKEFTRVETDVIQVLMVSLIPPFHLQFSSIYNRFKSQGKKPIPTIHSPAFGISSDPISILAESLPISNEPINIAGKKKQSVVSRFRSGLRKFSSKNNSQNMGNKKRHSLPSPSSKVKVNITQKIQAKSEGEEEYDFMLSSNVDINCETSAMGFFSLLDDAERNALKSKLGKRKIVQKNLQHTGLITNVASLLAIFPSCRDVLKDLLAQYEGNCLKIYNHLCSNNYEPDIEHDPEIFANNTDDHFTTKYFHGEAPSKEELAVMFNDSPCGTFITCCLSNQSEIFDYLLCYKNILDTVTEKPIRGPIVPQGLKSMLDLEDFIPRQSEVITITCLESLLEN